MEGPVHTDPGNMSVIPHQVNRLVFEVSDVFHPTPSANATRTRCQGSIVTKSLRSFSDTPAGTRCWL